MQDTGGFVTGKLSITDREFVTGNIKQLAIRCTGKGGERMGCGMTGCRASPRSVFCHIGSG